MRVSLPLLLSLLCASVFFVSPLQALQSPPNESPGSPAQTVGNGHTVEGTVVSTTRHTLVIRSDDNQYHLFTYAEGGGTRTAVKPGDRVRVDGGAPDADGTQVAENVAVIQSGGTSASAATSAQAVAPPPQVNKVTNQIERDARRWHGGGRIGVGFSPEIFVFGVQSQIGPIFNPHVLFRPNAEFGFGELTDMFAVNLEGAYRLDTKFHGKWTPYIGMGPSLNFIHQGTSTSDASFSDFNYKTGFNVFVGGQKNRTFIEMKTSLWSGQAPVLRLFVGYNF